MGQKRIIISYKKVSRNRYRFVIHQFGKPLYDRVHYVENDDDETVAIIKSLCKTLQKLIDEQLKTSKNARFNDLHDFKLWATRTGVLQFAAREYYNQKFSSLEKEGKL